MYVTIGTKTYSKLSGLSFAPETDVTNASLPVNEFRVNLRTADSISRGQYARLYDDLDQLWAKYWITYAERLDASTVQVIAKSDVAVLDRVELLPTFYDGADVADVLDETIVRTTDAERIVEVLPYDLDEAFDGMTVTGYCPKQSARERLQAVLLIIGGILQDWKTETLKIIPIDDTATLVPLGETYQRPSVSYRDHVSALVVSQYAFAEGTPTATDEYVTDGETTWIVTATDASLANTGMPEGAPDNPVTYDRPMLINSGNASGILSRLSAYWFGRTDIDARVVNNAQYWPGDRLTVYTGPNTLMSAYVQRCEFEFGLQAASRLLLAAAEAVEAAKLTIYRTFEGVKWGVSEYTLPVGYEYAVTSPYMDIQRNNHRLILRPTTATVTGTMTAQGATETVTYAAALDLDHATGVLHVISVDSVTEVTEESDEDTIVIGVIA